mmetsp:Transcript_101381/g.295357  ORF Transcript_101381/g.295357 Transcript_101381/m.295357 type:complete len:269 (-) Transcript_101381:213-1019(-)
MRVAREHYGLRPLRDVPGDVLDDYRHAEDSAIKHATDGPTGPLPHLLQVELEHASSIRRYGRALDANLALLDGLCSLQCDLVISLIPVRDAQVVIVNVHVYEGEDQLLLDHLPHDASHLVTIKLHYRALHLDLLKRHVGVDGPCLEVTLLVHTCDDRRLEQVPKLTDARLITSCPLCELSERQGVALERSCDLFHDLLNLEVYNLKVPEACIVEGPQGTSELLASHQAIARNVTKREERLELLLWSPAVACKQHVRAHLLVRQSAVSR